MAMIHPNARIPNRRNTSVGVETRSSILNYLEEEDAKATAREIAEAIDLKRYMVYFHLNRLYGARFVQKKSTRPIKWSLSGFGQKRLSSILMSIGS